MSKSTFLYFTVLFSFFCAQLKSESTDSLRAVLSHTASDSAKCRVLYSIMSNEENEDQTVKFTHQLIRLSTVLISKEGISAGEKTLYTNYLADSYNLLGHVYNNRGDVAKALNYYHEGLRVLEKAHDKAGIADCYLNIGYLYSTQDDQQRNFEFTQKALGLYQEVNNLKGIATALLNLGYYYEHKGKPEKGLDYFSKSLAIQQKLGDKSGVAYALANSGRACQKMGDYRQALANFQESLKMREELKDKKGIIYSLHKIGGLYNEEGKLSEALDYGSRAFVLAQETGYPDLIKRTSQLLYEVYRKKNNTAKALEMYELYIQMRDSISNEEVSKIALQKQLHDDYEKKEAYLKAEQERQRIIAEGESKKQKVIIYSVIIFLLLVTITAVNIFRSLRITRQQKRIIEQKSRETEEQKKLVEEKNKDILDSIHYARRIQSSLLTSEKYISRVLDKRKKDF